MHTHYLGRKGIHTCTQLYTRVYTTVYTRVHNLALSITSVGLSYMCVAGGKVSVLQRLRLRNDQLRVPKSGGCGESRRCPEGMGIGQALGFSVSLCGIMPFDSTYPKDRGTAD